MRDLLRLGTAICLCLFVITSCDEKEETPTPTPGEKAIQEIIDKLEELDDVTNFTAALKNIGSVDLENDQLTVFAIQDDGVKSADTKAGLTTSEVKRHIAKGKHDVSKFTNGETKELESIAGDKIVIVNNNGVITINGREMEVGTPVTVGNSIIFVVPEVIPEYREGPGVSAEREVSFSIREINDDWEEGRPDTFESENAAVILYVDDEITGKLIAIDTIFTNPNGIAVYTTSETDDLYYRIEKGSKTPFIMGYRVAGLFTTEDEIQNSPAYKTGTYLDDKYPGSLMLIDINGDARIDKEDDWFEDEYIQIDWESPAVDIVIVSPSNPEDESYEAALQKCEEELPLLFRDILAGAYVTDTSLVSGYAGFPTLNNIKDELEQLWHNSYAYIVTFNRNRLLFEDADCPVEYKNRWTRNYLSVGARNVAYIYSILINYWGEVPLITSTRLDVPAAKIKEISDYIIDMMNSSVPNDREHYAMSAIWNRVLLSPEIKEYEVAKNYYDRIIHSGVYKLSDNPYTVTPEMQLMEEYDLVGDGYPDYLLCFPEVYLGAAEAALALGKDVDAVQNINMILDWLGEQQISSKDIHVVLQELSLRLLGNEDKTFMLYKRWNMLEEKLKPFGFVSRNRLLPIPQSALDSNDNLQQYPGY